MGRLGVGLAVAVALVAVLCLGVAHLHEEGLRLSWPHFCSSFPTQVRPLLPICNGCSFCAPPSAVLLEELLPHLEALAAQVTISRDERDIPHIYGKLDSDVAFGLGYAQCEEHFREVQELILRSKCHSSVIKSRGNQGGRGPISQNGILSDSLCLLFEFERQLSEGYATHMSKEGKELLTGFAHGINYYAATHVDQLLSEDRRLLFPLNGGDIALATLARLPLLMEIEPMVELLLKEDPYYVVSFATEALEHEESLDEGASFYATTPSSTAYALRSEKSSDNSTVLIVNPHYDWEGPFQLFEAHARSEEGWDSYGGMWLATPSFPSGANPSIAWAHTLNFPDVADVFLLDVDETKESTILMDGEPLPLRVEQAQLLEPFWGPFHWQHDVTLQFSPYGPVLSRDHGSYAFRWAGHGRVGQLEQLHRMSKASSLEEWNAAMALQELPVFSFVYADAEDNVQLQYNGLLPVRDERFLWHVMVDGSDSRTLWHEYHELCSLPIVENPRSSFVVAANSSPFNCTARDHTEGSGDGDNPTPDGFVFEHGIETHVTNRAQRLIALLGEDVTFSLEELKRMKWDEEYCEDRAIIDVLVHVVDKLRELQYSNEQIRSNATVAAAVDLLASWDRRTDVHNRAAALAVLTASPFIKRGASDPLDYVRKNFVVVIQRFLAVAMRLEEAFGRMDVPWGDVQRLIVGEGDIPLGGAPDVLATVHSRETSEGKVEATGGDGLVLAVAFRQQEGEGRKLYMEALSPKDGELFAQRELAQVWLSKVDVETHARETYTPLDKA